MYLRQFKNKCSKRGFMFSNRPFGGGMNQRGPLSETSKWSEPPPALKPTSMAPPPVIPPTPVSTRAQRTNDVEIIVTHKSLTLVSISPFFVRLKHNQKMYSLLNRQYAEFIERRLKASGLNVDLLYPNEEVPLGRVLANIASRGSLYALVVTQLSEEHRSVTINVLYGQTQGMCINSTLMIS